MAFPIITLVFAALVAFFAFKTGGMPTGMDDAPAPIGTEAPADDEPADETETEAPAEEEE